MSTEKLNHCQSMTNINQVFSLLLALEKEWEQSVAPDNGALEK